MISPKYVKELAVRYLLRIVFDFYALCVITEAVIGRVLLGASRIADLGTDYAR
jgi:hypothetical protein